MSNSLLLGLALLLPSFGHANNPKAEAGQAGATRSAGKTPKRDSDRTDRPKRRADV